VVGTLIVFRGSAGRGRNPTICLSSYSCQFSHKIALPLPQGVNTLDTPTPVCRSCMTSIQSRHTHHSLFSVRCISVLSFLINKVCCLSNHLP